MIFLLLKLVYKKGVKLKLKKVKKNIDNSNKPRIHFGINKERKSFYCPECNQINKVFIVPGIKFCKNCKQKILLWGKKDE